MASRINLLSGVLALIFTAALASDSSPLQDFCVADANSADGGQYIRRSWVKGDCSDCSPTSRTFGISLARIDYAPWGINPPHTHPRASEILRVLEGCLEVGFVTSNPDNRLLTKVLKKGDVYVFPIGLIHYQRNVGKEMAIAIAALSSQNPGVITIANAVFGSNPDIPSDILAKAFQVDKNVVKFIQSKF